MPSYPTFYFFPHLKTDLTQCNPHCIIFQSTSPTYLLPTSCDMANWKEENLWPAHTNYNHSWPHAHNLRMQKANALLYPFPHDHTSTLSIPQRQHTNKCHRRRRRRQSFLPASLPILYWNCYLAFKDHRPNRSREAQVSASYTLNTNWLHSTFSCSLLSTMQQIHSISVIRPQSAYSSLKISCV